MKIMDIIGNFVKVLSKYLELKSLTKNSKNKNEIEEYKLRVTNEEFNKQINNGHSTTLCDTIRKKKQEKIDELKN